MVFIYCFGKHYGIVNKAICSANSSACLKLTQVINIEKVPDNLPKGTTIQEITLVDSLVEDLCKINTEMATDATAR